MRFLFRLDLSLHASVENFFWNFDFLTKHGPNRAIIVKVRSYINPKAMSNGQRCPVKGPPPHVRGALGEEALQRLPPWLSCILGGVETPPTYGGSFNSPYISNHTVSLRY